MAMARRLRSILAIALVGASLSACVTPQRFDAAGDIRALLISIRDDDEATFDAHIDRVALQGQLESRILERTEAAGQAPVVRNLGALLAGPISQFAVQALVHPSVFQAVAEYYGYGRDTRIPAQLTIAEAIKGLPDGRVCAVRHRGGPCVLTFAREDGGWRLVSFDGDLSLLRLR